MKMKSPALAVALALATSVPMTTASAQGPMSSHQAVGTVQ